MAARLTARLLPRTLLPRTQPFLLRTMSAAAEKHEFLVIVPDKPGVKDLRLDIRSQHLAELDPKIKSGVYQMGGGLLNDLPQSPDPTTWDFHGSTLVVVARSKEEVLQQIRDDIYTRTGVWDADKVQIFPFKRAFATP